MLYFMEQSITVEQKLSNELNCLGLDIDAFIHPTNGCDHGLQMSLSDASPDMIAEALTLINEIAFHPTLLNDNIEAARLNLLGCGSHDKCDA